MTTATFPPLPPEALSRVKSRSWVRRMQTALGTLILGGALALLLAVLVGVAPLFIGLHPFVIISGSMEPTIHTGSVVLTHAVPTSEVGVGDVIAFNPHADAALPVVHRIVSIAERNGTRYATTRGDANTGDDAEIVLSSPMLKVDTAIPLAGYAVYYAASPWGTFLLVWMPLGLLVALWLKDRVLKAYRWAHAPRV